MYLESNRSKWYLQQWCWLWVASHHPCLSLHHRRFFLVTKRVDLSSDSSWHFHADLVERQPLDANQCVVPNRRSQSYEIDCQIIHMKTPGQMNCGNLLVICMRCHWECDNRIGFISSQLWIGSNAAQQCHLIYCWEKQKQNFVSIRILTSNQIHCLLLLFSMRLGLSSEENPAALALPVVLNPFASELTICGFRNRLNILLIDKLCELEILWWIIFCASECRFDVCSTAWS